jgi:cytochrome c553
MDASTHASIRRQARQAGFPVPPSEQDIIAGGKLYLNDCVGCHSAPGKPASDFGATFYPQAPQFALRGTTYTEAEAFWAAKHGIRRSGMGAESGAYPDDKLRQLAAFICRMRTLSPHVVSAIQEKETPAAAPEAGK